MEDDSNKEDKVVLPHHEQQSLCTTRLPYRQGRKFTAVKVYSISKESNHLLIFGVPSLNLRQETKALFIKFGKLIQFNISTQHPAEPFTNTYHAQYEKIQCARVAKRMLDTKNFYGGSLHICYAPEMETIDETRQKLIQRQRDVVYRIRNLQKEKLEKPTPVLPVIEQNSVDIKKLNMGEVNTISIGKQIREVVCKKRKNVSNANTKKYKPCFEESNLNSNYDGKNNITNSNNLGCNITNSNDNKITSGNNTGNSYITVGNSVTYSNKNSEIDIVDCTGVDNEVITNINESLNYNSFGSEVIRKVPEKPVNKIKFYLNKNT